MSSKDQQIQWLEKTVRLCDLKPFEENPRTITENQFKKLKESIEQDGYHTRIITTPDLRVVGGHQRIRALTELGFTEVNILVPDRELTDQQFKAILVRSNHNNGVFDMDGLANMFDLEELRDFGLHEVMQIAPFDEEDKSHEAGKKKMLCPNCGECFPAKGNYAKEDGGF